MFIYALVIWITVNIAYRTSNQLLFSVLLLLLEVAFQNKMSVFGLRFCQVNFLPKNATSSPVWFISHMFLFLLRDAFFDWCDLYFGLLVTKIQLLLFCRVKSRWWLLLCWPRRSDVTVVQTELSAPLTCGNKGLSSRLNFRQSMISLFIDLGEAL